MSTNAAATSFREAPRVLGVTGRIEKRALVWMAARVPAAVTPDHLTLLGFAATIACGAAYALAGRWPWLLLAVNALLAVNWFGDSLDGTLARVRRSVPATASTWTTSSMRWVPACCWRASRPRRLCGRPWRGRCWSPTCS